jgi:chemotaxis protein CheD
MRIDVGIGDFKYSKSELDELKTYGLGSCVALVVYSKTHHAAGMIHIALPEASVNEAKAKTLPGYFADTGIPLVIDWVDRISNRNRKQFTFRVYGGASILDDNNRFDIGRRNALAIKRLLWKYGCGIVKEELGGNASRTVSIQVGTGEVHVNTVQKRTIQEGAANGANRART